MRKGSHYSEEQLKKLKGINKGHKYNLGKKHSIETKLKISKANKGNKQTKEQALKGALARTKHGACKTTEYAAWSNARSRCMRPTSPQYKDYGGRGITMCEEWNDFNIFIKDVGLKPSPELTLDRINNDGDYEPGNVRWATREQQQSNRRCTLNKNNVI